MNDLLIKDAKISADATVQSLSLNHVADFVFWKDRESRYLGSNKAFAAVAGTTPSKLLGQTDHSLVWGDTADTYIQEDRAVLQVADRKYKPRPLLHAHIPSIQGVKMPFLTHFGYYVSSREAEILLYLLCGYTCAEIAKSLNRSVRTIETHVAHLKYKFNCMRQSDLIKTALTSNFLDGFKPSKR